MLNATFQSHPIKMGCCNTITKSLIVTTINPIWRSRPVHTGTKTFNICSLKSKENIIFAHNFTLEKPKQTKQLVVLVFDQVYFSFHLDLILYSFCNQYSH